MIHHSDMRFEDSVRQMKANILHLHHCDRVKEDTV